MPLLIALWLALLGALAAPPHAGRVAASPGQAVLRPAAPPPPGEALRVARPVSGLVAARADATGSHGPPPAALPCASRPTGATAAAGDVRARSLDASHAEAARGGLLAYFPTAPPLRG